MLRLSFDLSLEVVEWIELGCLLLSVALAFWPPSLLSDVVGRWEQRFATFASHRWWPILAVIALPVVLRLCVLPVNGVPQPHVHDEFSMLLEADTFLHGRIANPTPAMWPHFETIYVLMYPSYASQYPPGATCLSRLRSALFWSSLGGCPIEHRPV